MVELVRGRPDCLHLMAAVHYLTFQAIVPANAGSRIQQVAEKALENLVKAAQEAIRAFTASKAEKGDASALDTLQLLTTFHSPVKDRFEGTYKLLQDYAEVLRCMAMEDVWSVGHFNELHHTMLQAKDDAARLSWSLGMSQGAAWVVLGKAEEACFKDFQSRLKPCSGRAELRRPKIR
jgi:hypothetical protein